MLWFESDLLEFPVVHYQRMLAGVGVGVEVVEDHKGCSGICSLRVDTVLSSIYSNQRFDHMEPISNEIQEIRTHLFLISKFSLELASLRLYKWNNSLLTSVVSKISTPAAK